jgi:ribosomal protein L32
VNPKDNSKFNIELPVANDPFALNEESEFSFDYQESKALNSKDNSKLNIALPEADDPFALYKESEFNYDFPESNKFIKADNEIMDLLEPIRIMCCTCSKCAEKTDVDLSQVPEDGFVITCSYCNKKIQTIRESFACRAKRKSYEINCSNCGKQLDRHTYCSSCGKLYPDYFVTINPDDARIKARREFFYKKWAAIRALNFSFKNISYSRSQDITHAYSPTRTAIKLASETSSLQSRKPAILALFFVVAVALVAMGVFSYNSYKSGQKYAENYFKALYCIKTGVDANLQTCAFLKADWESASASGRGFSPSINSKDEEMSIKLKGEVEKYLQKLGEPSKKYVQANESLKKIHKIYLDSDKLMFSKPNNLQELSNSIESLNKKLRQASQELKSNFPNSLKQEMVTAKLKYRGLKDF